MILITDSVIGFKSNARDFLARVMKHAMLFRRAASSTPAAS